MDPALEYRTRLNLVIERDNFTQRLGADDPNSNNVPIGLSFSTSIPGGYKDCTVTLPRKVTEDYPDLSLLDDVRVFGAGNQTAWEGRVAQLPRSHAEMESIQIGSVGWSAHLRDDNSFTEVYVDRDLNSWQPISIQRQIDYTSISYSTEDANVTPDTSTGQPALETGFDGPWGTAVKPISGMHYDSKAGVGIGSVYYAWKKAATVDSTDTFWLWQIVASASDTMSSAVGTGNLRGAGPSTGTLSLSGQRFAEVSLAYDDTGAGKAGERYSVYWTCLAVYGDHGLTKQGTADATNAQGYYASDIIANVVGRAAPLLTFSTGSDGSIENSFFVIPQMVFRDPSTAEDVILAANAYHLWEWGVYDNKEFFWRQTDPDRLCYEARLSDGASLDLEGQQAESSYNGVVVKATDAAGSTFTVGPTGSSADATSDTLMDTSDTNPVNVAGIPRRWALLEISEITTQAGAIQIGAAWLAEQQLPARRGQLTVTGEIEHPTEGRVPVWRVKAGDYVRIADFPTDVSRRVIETNYDHDTRTLTASLDNSAFKMEAILERMGVMLTGVV